MGERKCSACGESLASYEKLKHCAICRCGLCSRCDDKGTKGWTSNFRCRECVVLVEALPAELRNQAMNSEIPGEPYSLPKKFIGKYRRNGDSRYSRETQKARYGRHMRAAFKLAGFKTAGRKTETAKDLLLVVRLANLLGGAA